jgi:hypothetical protein
MGAADNVVHGEGFGADGYVAVFPRKPRRRGTDKLFLAARLNPYEKLYVTAGQNRPVGNGMGFGFLALKYGTAPKEEGYCKAKGQKTPHVTTSMSSSSAALLLCQAACRRAKPAAPLLFFSLFSGI